MAPTTRSRAGQTQLENDTIAMTDSGEEGEDCLVHLSQLQKNFRQIKQEVATLRKRNEELIAELEKAREARESLSQSKRGKNAGPSVPGLQKQITTLKAEIQDLKKARERDRKKIEKLQMKEAKADAEELAEQTEFEIGDSAHRMRKLLRQFNDLMLAGSLAEDETCPICFEPMEVGKCVSLRCEHNTCEDCAMQLSPDSNVIPCPYCRLESDKSEVEVIQYTAASQWDALLNVAQEWARIDRCRHEDTSEEEAEERFIKDSESTDSSSVLSEPPSDNPLANSPEPVPPSMPPAAESEILRPSPSKKRVVILSSEDEDDMPLSSFSNPHGHYPASASLDPGTSTPSRIPLEYPLGYSQSPRSEKARRLQELANKRQKVR